jgi:hypothetical protein
MASIDIVKLLSNLPKGWLIFRRHWELFPNTRDVTPDIVDELHSITHMPLQVS